ncbi:MAG: GAF domain-containing protein [Acidimicrobiales bacterium]
MTPAGPDLVGGLLEACAILVDTDTPVDERLQRLCHVARECCGCDRASMFVRRDDRFHALVNAGNPPAVAARFSGFSIGIDNPIVRELIEHHDLLVVDDAINRSGLRSVARAAGIHSMALAPMTDGSRLTGFLTIEQNERAIEISPAASEIAQGIASVAWALRRAVELEASRYDVLRQELLAEREDRRVIANRLHDGPQQTLVSLALRLQLVRDLIEDDALEQEIAALGTHTDQTRQELRELILDLDSFVGHRRLDTMLRTMLDSHAMLAGWTPKFREEGAPHELPLELLLTAERIVQEALANVRDHARARSVEVAVRHRSRTIEIRVTDDGVGLPADFDSTDPAHRGFASMRQRSATVDASLRVGRGDRSGTVIALILPATRPVR